MVAAETTVYGSVAGLTASAAGAIGDSGPISTASAKDLTPERTAKLLFYIPCLEFDPPIQIHSKARGDVKRLEKTDDGRVFNGTDPGVRGASQRSQIAPRVGIRMRRKPNLQKKHAHEQCELGCREDLRRGARNA